MFNNFYNKKIKISFLFIIIAVFIAVMALVGAKNASALEDKLTLTITPPLFKLNMEPGDNLNSAIKVVNNNSQPITVYASSMDFKGKPEGGVEFIQSQPADGEFQPNSHKLSSWLRLEGLAIDIAPQQSRQIPFSIVVPKDAEPGGHYGAIAIGTKPNEQMDGEGSVVKVSSMLTSLILLKIKGDINEEGRIANFSSEKKLYPDPEAKFDIEFANSGNVHLQPKGEIIIYNPYNKELARIKVNDVPDFGNVLPDSSRKWSVKWQGEKKFFDTGRHRAMLYLSYGDEEQQMASQMAYFWVADLRLIGMILGGVSGFILLLFLLIRFYVRRAVIKTQEELGLVSAQSSIRNQTVESINQAAVETPKPTVQTKPKGMIDLRSNNLKK